METIMYNKLSRKSIQLFTVAVLLMGAVGSVKAQSLTTVKFGFKAGVNYATFSDKIIDLSDDHDKKGKFGFNAGVYAQIGNRFYLQPELNYITFSNSYRFNAREYKAKFKDLNVPVMVGYKILNQEGLILRVSAGPEVYYNLNDQDSPTGSSYKKVSVGGVINTGLDLGNFTIDARNSIVISKLNKDLGQRPNIFSLSVGYKFP